MVRIRLSRVGRKNRPFFRINVFDGRTRRNGPIIEKLGWYDPLVKDEAKKYSVNAERARYWISVGAQVTETVASIFKKQGVTEAKSAETKPANAPKP